MKISIGADHRGFDIKEYLKVTLKQTDNKETIEWKDVGAFDKARSDYPEFTFTACLEVLQNNVDLGILVCGSGVGMSVAANKFPYIYAGIAWNEEVARRAKEEDNINVLVLPADYLNPEEALKIVKAWLNAKFKEGRYQERIDMIDEMTEMMMLQNDEKKSGCC